MADKEEDDGATLTFLYGLTLTSGCLCGKGSARKVAFEIVEVMRRDAREGQKEELLLMSVSLTRAVMETALAAAGGEVEACRSVLSVARALARCKWPLLAMLRRLMLSPLSSAGLASSCRSLFVLLAMRAPCRSEEICNRWGRGKKPQVLNSFEHPEFPIICTRSCHPLLRRLVRDVSSVEGAPDLVVMMLRESETKSPLRLIPAKERQCRVTFRNVWGRQEVRG